MFNQTMGPPVPRQSKALPATSRQGDNRYLSALQYSTPQPTRRPRVEDRMTTGKRRSSSLSRRSVYEVHKSTHNFSKSVLPSSQTFSVNSLGPDGSDTGSVASAPSLKYHPREIRDPRSTTGRPISKSNLYRDESPLSIRKHQKDFHQKQVKHTRKIIDELHRASESNSHERRLAAITSACADFDHADTPRHNRELQNGVARILAKFLATEEGDDGTQKGCAALEMVFRAQPTYAHVAFDKCGSSLIPTLIKILEKAEAKQMKHADTTILAVSRIFLYLSRVPDLRSTLARKKEITDFLRRVTTQTLNSDCRTLRMRIAANLVNCDDNKAFLCETPAFLETLLRVAHQETTDLAREYACLAISDLASSPANQKVMAENDKLLGALVKMVLVEKVASARESAITAVQNLAYTKENRSRLVTYKDGIVLEALRKALSGDDNDKARRRAAGAMTNLACSETAEIMGDHKGLLDTLGIVSTKDINPEVQSRAAMALTKLAASISMDMDCHETLLDALVVASLSKASNNVAAVLRVKARDPENREKLARHPGVLDTLADICTSTTSELKDKDNSMRALMHLTNESGNRKIMCNKKILEAMVQSALMEGSKMDEIRDSAIKAMERLATEFSNRAYMAKHPGLLTAIAKATERETKLERAGSKTEHAFLAKPLLMSLLVAM